MHYPDSLLRLIQMFRKLPGVGTKTAERFAFDLIDWSEKDLQDMANSIGSLKEQIKSCSECGCLLAKNQCDFCHPNRLKETLCILAYPRDVFAIEQTREYKGLYHVLGGVLSPMEGKGAHHLRISSLKSRLAAFPIKEVVIALDSTLEGDATSLFLKKELASFSIPISRLAFGLPMGSALEYVDGGTLARAMAGRRIF